MSELDGQLVPLLASLEAMGDSDLSAVGVEAARASIELMAQLQSKDKALLSRIDDSVVEGRFRKIPIRIYWPVAPEKCVGVTVFYHGGGFVLGSIRSHDQLARSLARYSNSVVVSVEYALAPENKFPAAVEDAYDAFTYVSQNRADLCPNPSLKKVPLAVVGDSAGGNLAAVVSYLARETAEKIDFALLAYPVTDGLNQDSYRSYDENRQGYFLTVTDMQWFGELYLRDESDLSDPRFSILLAPDLSNMPRTLVVVAGFDPLRDQGIAFADVLRKTGNQVELWRYDSMIHAFFSMEGLVDEAKRAVERAGKFLGDALIESQG